MFLSEPTKDKVPHDTSDCLLHDKIETDEEGDLHFFSIELFEIIENNIHSQIDEILKEIQNVQVTEKDSLADMKRKIKAEYLERADEVRNCILTVLEYQENRESNPHAKKIETLLAAIQDSPEFGNILENLREMEDQTAMNLFPKMFFSTLREEFIITPQASDNLTEFLKGEFEYITYFFLMGIKHDTYQNSLMDYGIMKAVLEKSKRLLEKYWEELVSLKKSITTQQTSH